MNTPIYEQTVQAIERAERRPDLAYYIWGGVFLALLIAGLLLMVGA